MNEQDNKKEKPVAPGPRANDQGKIESISSTTRPRMAQEEQQRQEREMEEIQHGDTAKGGKRGKYRQYEDSQTIIEKIRSYRTQRYPDSEIMNLLDNMPRRTYYNYVEKLQEQDRQIMEQVLEQNVEHVSEEMTIYRETLCQMLRELQAIIDNKNTSTRDKMQAIDKQLAISEKLAKFTKDERPSNIKSAKHDGYATF